MTLLALLPLAIGVGCMGCQINDDTGIEPGDTDTDTDSDTDTDTDFTATFVIDPPVDGAEISIYVRQQEEYPEDIGCDSFPCSHDVHKVGEWLVEAERDDYLFVPLEQDLNCDNNGESFDMLWTEEGSHGVLIHESTYESIYDGYEYEIYTQISTGSVRIYGLPLNMMPITGYEFNIIDQYNQTMIGEIAEDLSTIHWEKWYEGELIYEDDMVLVD